MKRFYSKKAKVLLAIACILFATCCLLSEFRYEVLHPKHDFWEHAYYDAGKVYAGLALSKYDSDFNVDLLNGMNCYFGIIDGDVGNCCDSNRNKLLF